MAWNTLYELTKLSDEAFAQAVGSGAISEQTTLNDARALRPRYIPQPVIYDPDYSEARLDMIRSRYGAPALPPPPVLTLVNKDDAQEQDQQTIITLPTVTIQQVERLVRDLQTEIERGTVRVDGAFVVIAQRIAEHLQAMSGMRRH
jgi:hypothetical protein